MNKYLLLRDNKQSGPYTVPEIISLGIKPYDLVWLEGKSAAWRYPSEIEELKAYAPAVEEQPFDRFYKKPEQTALSPQQVLQATIPEADLTDTDHNRFQPVDTPGEKQKKKVYINFPAQRKSATSHQPPVETDDSLNLGTPISDVPANQPTTITTYQSTKKSSTPAFPDRTAAADIAAENAYTSASLVNHSPAIKQPGERRFLHVAIAACLLLGLISGILYYNYAKQRQSLNELSSIVHDLESRENAAALPLPATQVQETVTETPPPTETVPATNDPDESATLPEVTEREIVRSPTKPLEENRESETAPREPLNAGSGVVFRETRRRENTTATPPPITVEQTTASPENLYNLVDVKPNDYKTGVLGGISNLKFALTNNSSVELHRVSLQIKYLGPEKKVVRTQTVHFENVAPGEQKTIDVPKSNRGVTIEYIVTDIKS